MFSSCICHCVRRKQRHMEMILIFIVCVGKLGKNIRRNNKMINLVI
jgi:hypothetical protein